MGDGDVGNIVFACHECGSMLSSELEHAGLAVQCPICAAETSIPVKKTDASRSSSSTEHVDGMPGKVDDGAENFITFVCQTCSQEIEAPMDMVRMNATCPTCGSGVNVPAENTPLQAREQEDLEADQSSNAPKPDRRSMTIRIDLSDID